MTVGSERIRLAGPRPESTSTPPDPRRWLAAAVMLAATFMDLLDSTIVNVAIPSIREDLGSGYAAAQWVTAGYALSFALLLITGGRLGDIVGRKRSFQLGVAGFAGASLLCGLASGPVMLAGARVLQGAAAALMVPLCWPVRGSRPRAMRSLRSVRSLSTSVAIALLSRSLVIEIDHDGFALARYFSDSFPPLTTD